MFGLFVYKIYYNCVVIWTVPPNLILLIPLYVERADRFISFSGNLFNFSSFKIKNLSNLTPKDHFMLFTFHQIVTGSVGVLHISMSQKKTNKSAYTYYIMYVCII